MINLQDKRWVGRLKAGDDTAFEKLYLKYNKKLFNFSYRLLQSRQEAEGLVQDTFMKLWEMRYKLDENYSFSGYIFKIARNKIYNIFRVRINERYYREYIQEYAEKLENNLERKLNYDELNTYYLDLISKLPERRKEIFLLSRNEGYTYREIAQRLQISENTVDTQIRKSLDFFRQSLREKYTTVPY
ncbi:MAG: RNA polymerase sigma-70 factor [Bacteroidales bacterium]|jgi:RNA polymerase sigma-70 factor (ECF subfamily)